MNANTMMSGVAPCAAHSIRPPAVSPGGRLLAIASSGACVSVAVLRAGPAGLECDSIAEPAGAEQSTRLLAMIDEVLGQPGLATVSAIAFDAGPGAFTGLRIACAVAQGLAFARTLPVIMVGSLEAAAWRSLRQHGASQAIVRVANDARMGELYAMLCQVRAPESPGDGPLVTPLTGPLLARPEALPQALARAALEQHRPELAGQPWLPAGDAWITVELASEWAQDFGDDGAVRAAQPADARAIAELGWTLWREGCTVVAEQAAPVYVRDKVALDVDEQARLRRQRAAR
ncbi:MAG: tRNA (adenosine(37)-N6)-threonylcarbamoyltransferase complex dimerization subunit type 1 TsaB [Burkholderiaceae bacterium]